MWTRVPGKNKGTACLAGVLALIWLALGGHQAWGGSDAKAAGDVEAAPQTQAAPQASEIAFTGKFSCPLKRQVVLPFKGIITSTQVQPGQKVTAGEVLAHYRLTPEAALQLRRRLAPPLIKDLEVRLADVEKNLSVAEAKYRETTQLAAKKLASEQALAQAGKERQLLIKQKNAVRGQLEQERQLAADDLRVLRQQLGDGLTSRQLPQEAALKAPISSYVLYVHPDLKVGMELEANTPAFQVGVMDPLVIKAQVHEMESLQLKVGDLAEISPESLPGSKFEARVTSLSWLPLKTGPEQPSYYEAEFSVPNPDLTLKEGMKVRIVLRKSR